MQLLGAAHVLRAVAPPAAAAGAVVPGLAALLVPALCLAVGLAGGALAYVQLAPLAAARAAPASPAAVQTAVAKTMDLEVAVAATGSVVARQAQLAFRTSGRIAKVLVGPGDDVAEGQPLATLDLPEAQTAEAQTAQAQARATLNLSKTRLDAARIGARPEDVRSVRRVIDAASNRLEQLPGGDAGVGQLATATAAVGHALSALEGSTAPELADVAAAQTALEDARSALDDLPSVQAAGTPTSDAPAPPPALPTDEAHRTRAALDRAGTLLTRLRDLVLAQAQSSMAQSQTDEAQRTVDGGTLRAPFAGIVGAVPASAGELVSANAPAVTLLDMRALRADVVVGEADVASIERGQVVRLAFDAAPGRSLTGQVSAIVPQPSARGGVTSYAVQIGLTPPPDLALFPGMTVQAQIVLEAAAGALVVPTRAVRVSPKGERTVDLLTSDGTFVTRTIETGLTTPEMTQVLDGLVAGDRVVLPLQS